MKENRKLLKEVLKDIRHDMSDEEEVNKYALSDKVSELLKLQLTITFENMNKENKERAQSIKSNIKAKEKELEQVETNYALCSDTKKQEICVKVMTMKINS